jgi:exopolysaccharide biosynthesis polyprenyl glycosylphosphotransferase
MYMSDLYIPNIKKFTRTDLIARVFISSSFSTALIVMAAFYKRSFAFPRTIVFISMMVDILFVLIFRILLRRFLIISYKRNLIIAGTGDEAVLIAREIKKYSSEEYNLVGFINEPESRDKKVMCISDIGEMSVLDISELDEISLYDRVNDLVIALDSEYHEHILKLIDLFSKKNINIKLLPNLYEIFVGRVIVGELAGIPLVEITGRTSSQWQGLAKKIIDFIFSLTALILLFPFMIILTVIIKITSKGPAIYVQERVQRPGKKFTLYKFRSMVKEAEKTTGPQMAMPADPRITPFGRWMRRYRIDEIPQLFNVLKGDMSLVGPRPEREHFIEQFLNKVKGYHRRFEMKPGITGLAQIHGRYDTSVENKLRYDLIFINNWSLLLDFKIMVLTIRVIFSGRGEV